MGKSGVNMLVVASLVDNAQVGGGAYGQGVEEGSENRGLQVEGGGRV